MHPRLAELAELLARHRAALLAAAAAVPAAGRERRPDPDTWSVAEVLDHLARVEAGSARLLARRVARARESGVGPDPETGPVGHRLDRFALADSPLRRVAPEIVQPAAGVAIDEALAALAASREALMATLRDADGVDLSRVGATHAALGELDGYEWFLFIGQHEARHARQIAAIGAALAGMRAGDTPAGDTPTGGASPAEDGTAPGVSP